MKTFLAVIFLVFSFCTDASARKCTGSSNCSACKNCSRCQHCNSGGGTCGVCSGGSTRTYPTYTPAPMPKPTKHSVPSKASTPPPQSPPHNVDTQRKTEPSHIDPSSSETAKTEQKGNHGFAIFTILGLFTILVLIVRRMSR